MANVSILQKHVAKGGKIGWCRKKYLEDVVQVENKQPHLSCHFILFCHAHWYALCISKYLSPFILWWDSSATCVSPHWLLQQEILQVLPCLQKIATDSHGILHMRAHWFTFSDLLHQSFLSEEWQLMSVPLQAEWGQRGFPALCHPWGWLPCCLTSPCYCFLVYFWVWKRCEK